MFLDPNTSTSLQTLAADAHIIIIITIIIIIIINSLKDMATFKHLGTTKGDTDYAHEEMMGKPYSANVGTEMG
jgi:hypothetical protein